MVFDAPFGVADNSIDDLNTLDHAYLKPGFLANLATRPCLESFADPQRTPGDRPQTLLRLPSPLNQ